MTFVLRDPIERTSFQAIVRECSRVVSAITIVHYLSGYELRRHGFL